MGVREWSREELSASAAEIHTFLPRPDHGDRLLLVCEPTSPALVLGSAQRQLVGPISERGSHGLDVMVRNSGGGAVAVAPSSQLWLTIYLRPDDPLVVRSIERSFDFLGHVLLRSLTVSGVVECEVVGEPRNKAAGRILCYAGSSFGEVTCGGRKLVGLSQRRTLQWITFHVMIPIKETQRGVLAILRDVIDVDIVDTSTWTSLDALIDGTPDDVGRMRLIEGIKRSVEEGLTLL